MSDEFKEFDTVPTPTLTLEPFGAEEKKRNHRQWKKRSRNRYLRRAA